MNILDENLFRDITSTVADLKTQKSLTDAEITNIKIRLESYIATTQEQFRTLGSTITEIRDMARDNKHITVGVDGNNGLKGTLEILVRDVTTMTKDFEFLRQTAKGYEETKNWFARVLVTTFIAIGLQFIGSVWTMNMQNNKQDTIREDLGKVMAFVNKQQQNEEVFKSRANAPKSP
jgi:hypothetical protein